MSEEGNVDGKEGTEKGTYIPSSIFAPIRFAECMKPLPSIFYISSLLPLSFALLLSFFLLYIQAPSFYTMTGSQNKLVTSIRFSKTNRLLF